MSRDVLQMAHGGAATMEQWAEQSVPPPKVIVEWIKQANAKLRGLRKLLAISLDLHAGEERHAASGEEGGR